MRQQTGASEHRQYATGRSRSAPAIQQPLGTGLLRRPPSVRRKKNRLSLTPPIQQHTGICQYTTLYHSAEQRRARKGGARGGKAGFVTLSAFPPRKPAHAKVSPRKGNPTAKVSPLERKSPPSDARHCTISGTIFSLFLSIIQLHVYYKEHTSKLLTLNSESVILWSS